MALLTVDGSVSQVFAAAAKVPPSQVAKNISNKRSLSIVQPIHAGCSLAEHSMSIRE